jgi:chorismate--pyruvate lyase
MQPSRAPHDTADASSQANWRSDPPYCPPGLAEFVTESGSLTDRLIATGLRFAVELLYLGPDRASRDEASLLDMPVDSPVLARHVALSLDRGVVVVARSLCRVGCTTWEPVLDRGGRSLGLTLFGDGADIARGTLSYCDVAAPHPLVDLAHAYSPDTLRFPARRCRFSRQGARLIVQEVFLPALATLTPAQPAPAAASEHRSPVQIARADR